MINWIGATQDVEIQTSTTIDTDTEQNHGWLPAGLVEKLCNRLKETPQFKGMSGRSYTQGYFILDSR